MQSAGEDKLIIAMVGLPAMGKSTVAQKLKENLEKAAIRVAIFNNGEVRRRLFPKNTSHAEFYDPKNAANAALRDDIALINIYGAKDFLNQGGEVAILDATNVGRTRRSKVRSHLAGLSVLFVECVNDDVELHQASIQRKIKLSEFAHLTPAEAQASFEARIAHYRTEASPFIDGEDFIRVDSLNNAVLEERLRGYIPFYPMLRDILVSDWVKSLYLVRHGETFYNLEDRIGGDSELTQRGHDQAFALARHFQEVDFPYVFVSTRKRTLQMVQELVRGRRQCSVIPLREFDEIDAGVCEDLSYAEVKARMSEEYAARGRDKYNYVYPRGEGYVTLKERVTRGLRKALYLSGNAGNILIVGHQAVNRMILSHFLFRRTEDVPFIYIPQTKYFYIVSTHTKKLIEHKPF